MNLVLKWVKRKSCFMPYPRMSGKLRIVAVNDSAFRRELSTGLAMRGTPVLLNILEDAHPREKHHIIEHYGRKQKQVRRSTLGAEQGAAIDEANLGVVIASAYTEVLFGPMSPAAMLRDSLEGRLQIAVEFVTDALSVFDALQNPCSRAPLEKSWYLV